ncbi:hypothetical protein DW352_06555 [Pseudolabrys taiwanensis]|uniref:Uncharacterized protein n=1 Tax=Pseudolabrys taiwanensis TaxID=331696 RepID=A0A345ZTG1_9HYPH|nr:hypothetical protein [Pseudolabrys taiwanensis]AXK80208.1 hypothetical protein DW352_06555 [Pseudolabrys taiwanensis]
MSAVLALHVDRAVVLRGIVAGTAWGLALSAGFVGIALTQCGLPCPDDIAFTTLVSVATGIVAIGPLAAFAKRPNA